MTPVTEGAGNVGSFQEEHFSGLDFNMTTQVLINFILDAATHKNDISYFLFNVQGLHIWQQPSWFLMLQPSVKRNLSYAKMKSHTKMNTDLLFKLSCSKDAQMCSASPLSLHDRGATVYVPQSRRKGKVSPRLA